MLHVPTTDFRHFVYLYLGSPRNPARFELKTPGKGNVSARHSDQVAKLPATPFSPHALEMLVEAGKTSLKVGV